MLHRQDSRDRETDRQTFRECLHAALMAGDDQHVLEILGVGRPEDAPDIIAALRRVLWPESGKFCEVNIVARSLK